MVKSTVFLSLVLAVTLISGPPASGSSSEESPPTRGTEPAVGSEEEAVDTVGLVFYELLPESAFANSSSPAPWVGIRPATSVVIAALESAEAVAASSESLFPSMGAVTIGDRGVSTGAAITLKSLQLADQQEQLDFAGSWGSADLSGVYYPDTTVAKAPCRLPVYQTSNPLYFEQAELERCGNSVGYLTTAYSLTRFMADVVLLPAHIAGACPGEKVRLADSQCSCSECNDETLEVSLGQLFAEGGAITALFFIIP